MRNRKDWTTEEEKSLSELYPSITDRIALEKIFGRSSSAIGKKARKIGLNAPPRIEWVGRAQKMATEAALIANKGSAAKGKNTIGYENHRAKVWQFENKSLGVVISGTNLNHLIREHRFLFSDGDVDENIYKRGRKCRAAVCLRNLAKQRNAPSSWKGWVFLRKSHGSVGEGLDFIGIMYTNEKVQS